MHFVVCSMHQCVCCALQIQRLPSQTSWCTIQTQNMLINKYADDMMEKWYALSTLCVRNILSESGTDGESNAKKTGNYEDASEGNFEVDFDLTDESDHELDRRV